MAATAVSASLASGELEDARAAAAAAGIRRSDTRRDALHRHSDTLDTRFGPTSVKVAHLPNGGLRATPEYEDCRKAAEKHGVSLHTVTHEAEHAAAHKFGIPH